MQTATTLMAADCHSTTLKSDHGNHHYQDPGQIRCKEERPWVTDFQRSCLLHPLRSIRHYKTQDRPTQPVPASWTDMRFNYLTGASTTIHLAIQQALHTIFVIGFHLYLLRITKVMRWLTWTLTRVCQKQWYHIHAHTITSHHATAEKGGKWNTTETFLNEVMNVLKHGRPIFLR